MESGAIGSHWKGVPALGTKGTIVRIMRQPVIVDGRNIYNPNTVRKLGLKYIGMGRV